MKGVSLLQPRKTLANTGTLLYAAHVRDWARPSRNQAAETWALAGDCICFARLSHEGWRNTLLVEVSMFYFKTFTARELLAS